MDKTVYETFEFVETTSETEFLEPNQYFVVQNDGTLLVNKQVQLVTKIQDADMIDNSQDVQACPTMYHIPQQQEYFVNSTEYLLPDEESGTGNYDNRVLLQQTHNPSVEQMPSHMVVDDLKPYISNSLIKEEMNQMSETGNGSNLGNSDNSCTEITLNDEQWRMMQRKGWLLLEISDKIFLLDTLGLHDITENEELIQKLRSENVTSNFIANNESPMTPVNLNDNELQIDAEMFPNETCDDQTQSNQDIVEQNESMLFCEPQHEVPETREELNDDYKVDTLKFNTAVTELSPKTNNNEQNSGTVVRLITNYSLKDIPQKMILGKTASGKNLVARVVSVKKKPIQNENTVITRSSPNPPSSGATQNISDSSSVSQFENVSKHELGKVDNIVRQFLSLSKQTMCSSEDIHAAKAVITQLLNVPTTRQPLLGRNLILTKIVKTMNESELLISESKPTLVPGKVIQTKSLPDDWNFEYVPNLLHTIIKNNETVNNAVGIQKNNNARSDYILHIHVVEIKRPNSPLKTSITFSRRNISRLRQLTVHACSACANVFQTVQELNHHKNKCLVNSNHKSNGKSEVQDTRLAEESPINEVGYKSKLFDCSTCTAKNMNKRRYTRHLKSHFGPTNRQSKKPPPTKPTNLYQCKMCLVSFYHSATLSKHINSQHLQGKGDVLR